MKIALAFILSLQFSGLSAFAQTEPDPSAADMAKIEEMRRSFKISELHRDPIYLQTKRACESATIKQAFKSQVYFQVEKTRIGVSAAWQIFKIASLLDTEAAFKLYQDRGLSPRLAELTSSQAFALALDECFPDRDFARKAYIAQLGIADAGGKLGGGAASIYFWLQGGIYLTAAAKMLPPLVLRFVIIGAAASAAYNAGKPIYQWYRSKKADAGVGQSQTYQNVSNSLDGVTSEIERSTMAVLDAKIEEASRALDEILKEPAASPETVKAYQERLERFKLAKTDFQLTLAGK